MKKIKKIAAMLTAAVMLLSLAACGSDSSAAQTASSAADNTDSVQAASKLEQIKEAGVLVLGTSADCPPAEFHTEIDGVDTIVGYDISLAQYIADDLGVELKIVDMAFDSLCMGLSKGEFDMVIASMAATDERRQSIDFSDAYYNTKQAILIQKSDDELYNSPEDLAGKKVGVQNGSIQVAVANELAGEENVVGLVKVQDLIMELKSDKLDAVYIDYTAALAYASANDDLLVKEIGIEYESEGQAIGVQKGNEAFVEYLNGIVAEVTEGGTMEQFIADAQLLAGI